MEDKLREIAKEEMQKAIMENLDSTLIFTYINKLEEENKQLKFDKEQERAIKRHYKELLDNSVSKDEIKEVIYPTPENPIEIEIQTSAMYIKLQELLNKGE